MTTNQALIVLRIGQCITVTLIDDHHGPFSAQVTEIKKQDPTGCTIFADLSESHGSFGDKVVLCTDPAAHGADDHVRCINHQGYISALDESGSVWYGVRAAVAAA